MIVLYNSGVVSKVGSMIVGSGFAFGQPNTHKKMV